MNLPLTPLSRSRQFQDINPAECMFKPFPATGDMLAGESDFDLLLAPSCAAVSSRFHAAQRPVLLTPDLSA